MSDQKRGRKKKVVEESIIVPQDHIVEDTQGEAEEKLIITPIQAGDVLASTSDVLDVQEYVYVGLNRQHGVDFPIKGTKDPYTGLERVLSLNGQSASVEKVGTATGMGSFSYSAMVHGSYGVTKVASKDLEAVMSIYGGMPILKEPNFIVAKTFAELESECRRMSIVRHGLETKNEKTITTPHKTKFTLS